MTANESKQAGVTIYSYDSDNEHMTPELFGTVEMVRASDYAAAIAERDNAKAGLAAASLALKLCGDQCEAAERERDTAREALREARLSFDEWISIGRVTEAAKYSDYWKSTRAGTMQSDIVNVDRYRTRLNVGGLIDHNPSPASAEKESSNGS